MIQRAYVDVCSVCLLECAKHFHHYHPAANKIPFNEATTVFANRGTKLQNLILIVIIFKQFPSLGKYIGNTHYGQRGWNKFPINMQYLLWLKLI